MKKAFESTEIKLLVLDIDGVLTDGRVIIDASSREYKSINYRDLDGIAWLKKRGVGLVLLTGEKTAIVGTLAKRFGISKVIKGAKDKEKALKQLLRSSQVPLKNICYVGDSDRDAYALRTCGLGIVPQDATKKAKESASVVLKSKGGNGVVHEIIEHLVKNGYIK